MSPVPPPPGLLTLGDQHPGPALSFAELLTTPGPLTPPFTPTGLGCSLQTWQTLVRDGDLVEVRPGYAVVPGTPMTEAVRAQSLCEHLPREVVVGRATAVWVHTGLAPEDHRITVLYAPGSYRPRDSPHVKVSQASVRNWEIVTIATVPVTGPVRTAMDVATWCPRAEALRALQSLVDIGLDLDEVLRSLDRVASWRGADRARSLIVEIRNRPRHRHRARHQQPAHPPENP